MRGHRLDHLTNGPYLLDKKKEESRHRLIFPGRRQPSIFSTRELNYRVRNGNGWILAVIDTDYSSFQGLRPEKQITLLLTLEFTLSYLSLQAFQPEESFTYFA